MNPGKEDSIEEMIPIGRIVKPHGLRGEVKAKISLDDDTTIRKMENVLLLNEDTGNTIRVRVNGARKSSKGWIIHFDGFDSIERVDILSGYHIYLKREVLPLLHDGEYYFFQLLGCRVLDESGRLLGFVEDIIETGSNDVMVVRRKEDDFSIREELVPLIKDCVISMDFEGKEVVVRLLNFEEVD
jgi:16S rRNA processing protein RimM